MKTTIFAGLAAATALGSLLVAGTASAAVPYPHPHNVNQRLRDQHARIRQGIRSGQLTWRETRNLDRRDARVVRQEQRDRFFHNGHLTSGERRQLNHELNRDSRAIYRDKHNDRVR
ncbi:MAG: hypothetical protein JO250_05655 [Armatimonadetes bacterium]|nr:hypothetical protein [Armatimonadota bacterium]